MFSDQKSCEGDILEEEMGRESGLTYLNLRCDDTRKVLIEQIHISIHIILKGGKFSLEEK